MVSLIESHYTDISLDQHSIANSIGNTPLIEIRHPALKDSSVRIYAKAEWLNPGGSVKDRAALSIIQDALLKGELNRNKILVDASSGNTAIAYAMICSSLGIKCKLFIPGNVSKERIRILRSYGTELILTDPLEGVDGSIELVREFTKENSEKYFYANQYDNPANWLAHYNTTGIEIFKQTNGKVNYFVAGLGTSGTFTGTSRRLKQESEKIQTGSFQPNSPFHGLEGLKHMDTAIIPKIYDRTLNDFEFTISTEDAYHQTKFLAKSQGLLVGISSGAALSASLSLATTIAQGNIITIFPDRGERYLTDNFWRNSI